MKQKLLLIICLIISSKNFSQFRTKAQQQIFSNEDSLNAGIATNKTVISCYGSAAYQRNFNLRQSTATLERAVLFHGVRLVLAATHAHYMEAGLTRMAT